MKKIAFLLLLLVAACEDKASIEIPEDIKTPEESEEESTEEKPRPITLVVTDFEGDYIPKITLIDSNNKRFNYHRKDSIYVHDSISFPIMIGETAKNGDFFTALYQTGFYDGTTDLGDSVITRRKVMLYDDTLRINDLYHKYLAVDVNILIDDLPHPIMHNNVKFSFGEDNVYYSSRLNFRAILDSAYIKKIQNSLVVTKSRFDLDIHYQLDTTYVRKIIPEYLYHDTFRADGYTITPTNSIRLDYILDHRKSKDLNK